MGYNFYQDNSVKDSFKVKLKDFLASLGPAISKGADIPYADNDITYSLKLQHNRLADKGIDIEYEMYERENTADHIIAGSRWRDAHYESTVCIKNLGVKRNVTKGGRSIYKDNRKTVVYQTITDVLTGSHPDDDIYCCPSCGADAKISELVNGCPYCGIRYKMDDLFPKVTGYYFRDDEMVTGNEGRKGLLLSVIITSALAMTATFIGNLIALALDPRSFHVIGMIFGMFGALVLGAVFGYLIYSGFLAVKLIMGVVNSSSKLGTVGSRKIFEEKMKRLSPEFSFEYFTSKAVSLIRSAVFAEDAQTLLSYKGGPLSPSFKNIIDFNYGGALGISDFIEKDGITTVVSDAFFDALYNVDDTVALRHLVFRAVFQRRTDIPVDMNFSMTRIQCLTCATSFDATRNKICPSCGHEYELISDDWVLVDLKVKQ